jgi:type IV secretory pathway TrbL component
MEATEPRVMLIVVYLGMYSERFDDTKRGNQNPYIKEKHTMTKIKRFVMLESVTQYLFHT